MLRSKLLVLSRVAGNSRGIRNFSTTGQKLGGHDWCYREFPMAGFQKTATFMGGLMWWWIWWHVFTDYHHLIGHYPFPDATSWTDAELGVPPDTEELHN